MYQICLAVVSRIINKYVRAKHSQAKQPHSRSGTTTTTTTTSRRSRSTWKITSVTGKLMSRTKQLAHSASTDRFVNSHAHSHKHTRSLSLAFVIILALPHTHTHTRAVSLSISVGLGFANCVRSLGAFTRQTYDRREMGTTLRVKYDMILNFAILKTLFFKISI